MKLSFSIQEHCVAFHLFMFSFVSLESFKHIYSYKSCTFLLIFSLEILSFFSYCVVFIS